MEATAYVGESGRTHVHLKTEYELLFTNRAILQPLLELDIYGKRDPERGIGAGLSSVEAGLRLRYEFRRQFAPYVGVTWNRKLFGTADLAETAGDRTGGARLALGVRVWF
jgi:copper resistance protein B